MIPVTKSYLPSIDKYKAYIDSIYESAWLTNNGVLVQELEKRLRDYLDVKHIILVANGSLALQLSYKALDLTGEVITTPFSFVATTSTLTWEGLDPVFADIDPKSFNIDPNKIEEQISDRTSAIVPVHVFGNPCDVESIADIADKHNLKVIYDAAHAFGTQFKEQSVLNYGDISTLSFHATKLFHTIEGGAIITNDDDIADKVRLLMNFGITGPTSINSIGTNAKMNEFEAAMGLCVLDEIEAIQSGRQAVWAAYEKAFLNSQLRLQQWNSESLNNYAYAPVIFPSEQALLKAEQALKDNDILPRRYFYPSLDTLPYLDKGQVCKQSRELSSRILCLPIYPNLSKTEVVRIIDIIKGT